MSTKSWLGIAQAVAQVTTIQVTGYDATTTYIISINGIDIVAELGDTDADGTATALQVAWEASAHVYKTSIVATVATDTVTLTGPAGLPFTVVSSVSGGAGTIGAATEATAATGPNFWDDADNWSTGAVPVSADDVIITNSAISILFGLDQSAVDLASLKIELTYTGKIGLPFNQVTLAADGSSDATLTEYRAHYLDIGADVVEYGAHNGPGNPAGSGRIKIDNDKAGASEFTVFKTAGQGADIGLPAVRYLAAHASANINVRSAQGGLGIGVDEAGEAPTIGTLNVTSDAGPANVFTGPGATVGGLIQSGGNVLLNGTTDIVAATMNAGELAIEGDYKVTTLTITGGQVFANNVPSSGDALTTVNMTGGNLRGDQSMQARTWGTVNCDKGTLVADDAIVTITTLDQPAGLKSMTVS